MLISDIAAIVQNSIGDRGGIVARDDLVIFWVNEAILDIFRKTEIGRESTNNHTINTGEDTFDPTDDSRDILRMHYMHNGEFEMQETTVDELLNSRGVDWLTTAGVPSFFWRGYEQGHTVVKIAPKADKNYKLIYSATWVPVKFTLTSQNTSTLLPPSFDNDVIRFAIMRAHELEKDFRASEKAQEHYANNMFERADETHALDDSYSTISPDEWDYV